MVVTKEDFVEGTIIDYHTDVYYKIVDIDKDNTCRLKMVNKNTLKDIDDYASGRYTIERNTVLRERGVNIIRDTVIVTKKGFTSWKDKIMKSKKEC